ncbi:DinB family protein [Dyella tabacisoli]|uniref:Damage-inducible protein DinB n=1 Tax=Dyella tabacisoli TaxID=2282381 RepID=A0A369UN34_9GAMM|nr:DinB family protein [Dyella tabacisoli]RDD81138.1 damage-inducible protein DinB [Dyella tabacisoli]
MSTKQLRMLARYKAWANQLIFDAVSGLPAIETSRPRQTVFGNMLRTLSHSYAIDRIFQAHLQGGEHGFTSRNTPEPLPLDQLWPLQQAVDQWYVAWSDAQDAQSIDESVPFSFIGGGQGVMTRAEMLLHVVNHTTYHRGFVADMFYQVQAKPPTTDLPVFLRDVAQNQG